MIGVQREGGLSVLPGPAPSWEEGWAVQLGESCLVAGECCPARGEGCSATDVLGLLSHEIWNSGVRGACIPSHPCPILRTLDRRPPLWRPASAPAPHRGSLPPGAGILLLPHDGGAGGPRSLRWGARRTSAGARREWGRSGGAGKRVGGPRARGRSGGARPSAPQLVLGEL